MPFGEKPIGASYIDPVKRENEKFLSFGKARVRSILLILLQNPLFSEKWVSLEEKTSMISTPIFFKNPVSRGFAAESRIKI